MLHRKIFQRLRGYSFIFHKISSNPGFVEKCGSMWVIDKMCCGFMDGFTFKDSFKHNILSFLFARDFKFDNLLVLI